MWCGPFLHSIDTSFILNNSKNTKDHLLLCDIRSASCLVVQHSLSHARLFKQKGFLCDEKCARKLNIEKLSFPTVTKAVWCGTLLQHLPEMFL